MKQPSSSQISSTRPSERCPGPNIQSPGPNIQRLKCLCSHRHQCRKLMSCLLGGSLRIDECRANQGLGRNGPPTTRDLLQNPSTRGDKSVALLGPIRSLILTANLAKMSCSCRRRQGSKPGLSSGFLWRYGTRMLTDPPQGYQVPMSMLIFRGRASFSVSLECSGD